MSELILLSEQLISLVWEHGFAVLGWVIAIVAFVLVPFRRPAAEARSWLLIFFALPWLALVIYWVIGRPHYAKERRDRFRQLPQLLAQVADLTDARICTQCLELSADNVAVSRLVEGLGQFPAVAGNQVELLSEYDGFYVQLIADINAAQSHIHLEFYIFSNDAIGDRIMSALERASQRGVSCRVLVDGLGSYGSIYQIKRRLRRSGVEMHDILPLHRRWNSSRFDLRNHRKIAVIDGRVGYTGSQNIWDPAQSSRRSNQELVVRLQGAAVGQLQTIFIADWYLETLEELTDHRLFPEPTYEHNQAVQVLASGPDFPEGGVDLVFTQAMHNAAHEIVIVTPYFIPNDALLSAIKSAVIGGVEVHLILAKRSDHKLVGLAQRSYYAELLSVGAQIHLFGPDFLHAKHFRVDNEVCIIGSSNMDLRSFELNAEIDLICFGEEVTEELQSLEASYLERSEELTLDDWKKRSLASKVLENSARLLGDLI